MHLKDLAEQKKVLGLQCSQKHRLADHQKRMEDCSPEFWRQKFLEFKYLHYRDLNHLYTDASKTSAGTALDCTDQQVVTEKINPNLSINNTELLAIFAAIEIAKNNKISEARNFLRFPWSLPDLTQQDHD